MLYPAETSNIQTLPPCIRGEPRVILHPLESLKSQNPFQYEHRGEAVSCTLEKFKDQGCPSSKHGDPRILMCSLERSKGWNPTAYKLGDCTILMCPLERSKNEGPPPYKPRDPGVVLCPLEKTKCQSSHSDKHGVSKDNLPSLKRSKSLCPLPYQHKNPRVVLCSLKQLKDHTYPVFKNRGSKVLMCPLQKYKGESSPHKPKNPRVDLCMLERAKPPSFSSYKQRDRMVLMCPLEKPKAEGSPYKRRDARVVLCPLERAKHQSLSPCKHRDTIVLMCPLEGLKGESSPYKHNDPRVVLCPLKRHSIPSYKQGAPRITISPLKKSESQVPLPYKHRDPQVNLERSKDLCRDSRVVLCPLKRAMSWNSPSSKYSYSDFTLCPLDRSRCPSSPLYKHTYRNITLCPVEMSKAQSPPVANSEILETDNTESDMSSYQEISTQSPQRKVSSLRVIGSGIRDEDGLPQGQQLDPHPAQVHLSTLQSFPQEKTADARSSQEAGEAAEMETLTESSHKVQQTPGMEDWKELPPDDSPVKESNSEPSLTSSRLLQSPTCGEIIMDSEDESGTMCNSSSKLSLRNYQRTRFNTFIPTFHEHFKTSTRKLCTSWRDRQVNPLM